MAAPSPSRLPLEEIKQALPQVDSLRLGLLEQRLFLSSVASHSAERSPTAAAIRSQHPTPAAPALVEARKEPEPKAAPTDDSASSSDTEENQKNRPRSPTAAPPARAVLFL